MNKSSQAVYYSNTVLHGTVQGQNRLVTKMSKVHSSFPGLLHHSHGYDQQNKNVDVISFW